MFRIIKIIMLIVFGYFLSAPSFILAEDVGVGKNEKIIEIIKLTGVAKNFILLAQSRVDQFKEFNSSVPKDLWVEAEKRANINQRITDAIVENYAAACSAEDSEKILQIVTKFQGKSLAAEIYAKYPELSQSFMLAQSTTVRAMEDLNKKVAEETQAFLQSKGYTIQISQFDAAQDNKIPSSGQQP